MALSVDDIKKMPVRQKVLALFVLFILLGFAYYSIYYQNAMQEEERLQQNLRPSRSSSPRSRSSWRKNLSSRRDRQLQEQLKVAMAKLPEQKEIPGLLISMSEAEGLGGVEFQLFEPLAPVREGILRRAAREDLAHRGVPRHGHLFEKVRSCPASSTCRNLSMERGKAPRT